MTRLVDANGVVFVVVEFVIARTEEEEEYIISCRACVCKCVFVRRRRCARVLRQENEDVMSSPFFFFSALQSHKFLVLSKHQTNRTTKRDDQSPREAEGEKQNATKKLKVEREKEIISITLIINIGVLASLL